MVPGGAKETQLVGKAVWGLVGGWGEVDGGVGVTWPSTTTMAGNFIRCSKACSTYSSVLAMSVTRTSDQISGWSHARIKEKLKSHKFTEHFHCEEKPQSFRLTVT